MSTLSALEIADLIRDKAMNLTKDQPVDGYVVGEDDPENVWIICQADFDYEYGALVQLITPSIPRPYIMIWWWTEHRWDDEAEARGLQPHTGIDRVDVEWIHNADDSVSWTDAISRWGSWIDCNKRDRSNV